MARYLIILSDLRLQSIRDSFLLRLQLRNNSATNQDHCECISCPHFVMLRQQALQCDGCERWQHCTSGTEISQQEYREAVYNGGSIDWLCGNCFLPVAESSRLSVLNNGEYIIHLKRTVLNSKLYLCQLFSYIFRQLTGYFCKPLQPVETVRDT